ncbi:MAG: hypothetical protein QM727_08690 [Niabella sp.]
MAKDCKIEFYFRKKDLEQLIKENPDADGIIIRQALKPRKGANKENITVAEITAYPHWVAGDKAATLSKKSVLGDDNGSVSGCPYPPGCEH